MLRALRLALLLGASALPGQLLAQQAPSAPVQAPQASVIDEEAPRLYDLFRAIGLYEVLEVMAVEGIDYADDLEADMFPGQGGPAWPAMVAQIYAFDRLVADFEAAFPRDAFTAEELAELTAFFTSDTGRAIIEGEIEARRAISDPAVEEAANEIYADALASDAPRLELLEDFNDVNSLVDLNVGGALNSNFAFYEGLVDGGAFDVAMPEDLMLAEVWSQEPEIRAETVEWLYSYQLMAYDGLSDAQVQAYIDLSRTSAGRAMNRALFTAFDAMFLSVTYDLGKAAAVFIAGEET